MTVLPAPDEQTVSLVCDTCGESVSDIESPADNWPVIWAVVQRTGWAGSPLVLGPHHCPQCNSWPPGPGWPAPPARTAPPGRSAPHGGSYTSDERDEHRR